MAILTITLAVAVTFAVVAVATTTPPRTAGGQTRLAEQCNPAVPPM